MTLWRVGNCMWGTSPMGQRKDHRGQRTLHAASNN
eukprot:CAMPEP_0180824758 /NCGR_PEP_ID=MMETSP1038_2-20121128/72603_1 /TAXON_ID=632150 /ORGANISM="Azadinium spinosum, Strain 3D9" /LENGTH=34 /DNA_ID= /DNA_START= /DNA_END= /DNA_ORIENTATION=